MATKKSKKKKKPIKTKLFDAIETEDTEKDFLIGFIKVGTDITMLDTTHSKQFMIDGAFKRRTVMELEGYKIIFQFDNPDVGYLRHFSFLYRPHTLEIKKKSSLIYLLKVTQDGRITNYKLENYV